MRDVIKIFAAGSILTAYALVTPTLVEAVPGAPPKAFAQRLPQADIDAPVSAVRVIRRDRVADAFAALPGEGR